MAMKTPWHTPASTGEWRRALVYGLGLSGVAAAALLRSRGVEVWAVDRRPAGELQLGALATDPFFHLLAEPAGAELPSVEIGSLDGVVLSPGVPADKPLLQAVRAAGLPLIAEVELAFPFLDGPLVGITGSNGKSTTTAMTAALLRHAGFDAVACGNIGEPLSGLIPAGLVSAKLRPNRIYVAELSSFQLEGIATLRPRAAVLTNLSPDHLDRHGSLEAYLQAKLRLFANQEGGDVAVLNADDAPLQGVQSGLAGRVRFFSRRGPVEDGCFVDGGQVVEAGPAGRRELFALADIPIPGGHNIENAMAAALLALALGAPAESLPGGLRAFRGLPHRIEKVRERGGVTWYDDSKGTNQASTLGALDGFAAGKLLLILGGRFKGGELETLARAAAEKARHTYLIGESMPVFAEALSAAGASFTEAGTLARTIELAAEVARPGDAVLLSPACASFDQFANYHDRGMTFQRLVNALPSQGAGDGP
jgi:UDP-N-acetylmuramoylalanine--D-glutamate ligase